MRVSHLKLGESTFAERSCAMSTSHPLVTLVAEFQGVRSGPRCVLRKMELFAHGASQAKILLGECSTNNFILSCWTFFFSWAD